MPQFYAKLEELIEQNNIVEFRKFLQNSNPSDLTDSSGKTLLHLAAQSGNADLAFELLLNSQHDVNARDSIGTTPILAASYHKNYKVVKILLANRADIFISDSRGSTLLGVLVRDEATVPTEIFRDILRRLMTSGIGVKKITATLVKSNCSLDLVLLMGDPNVTRAVLKSRNSISEIESCALVSRALATADFENLEVLLTHGPDASFRRERLLREMFERLLSEGFPNFEIVKILEDTFLEWGRFDGRAVAKLQRIFHYKGEDIVRAALECGIVELVRKSVGIDLIPKVFANRKFEASKLLRGRKFDVNAEDEQGYTALQVALIHKREENVKFLLNLGADPNAKGHCKNQTPLQMARTDRCVALLLQYGADTRAIVERWSRRWRCILFDASWKPVLARLMLDQAEGSMFEIPQESRSRLLQVCRHVDDCRKQIEWSKTRKVNDSISLFDALSGSVERLARHVRDGDTAARILNAGREGNLDGYYLSALENKLGNAVLMHTCKLKLAEVLADVLELCSSDHLVIENIVGWLKFKDLFAMS